MENWWAHLDSNLGPRDYESHSINNPQQHTTSNNNIISRLIGFDYHRLLSFIAIICSQVSRQCPTDRSTLLVHRTKHSEC